MNKSCVACGKEIPQTATTCVFCAAPQDEADAEKTELVPVQPPSPSRAHVTLIGLRVEDLQAAMDTHVEATQPVSADATPVRGLPVVPEDSPPPPIVVAPPAPVVPAPVPIARPLPPRFAATARLVMASGGLVLIALFSLPWHGLSSWQLLETLAGAEFVRQLFFLAGGTVLVATALLPVPAVFRAIVGVLVAALPLVLGAEGLLEGWRGGVAAFVTIGLPAALLQLRPRRAPRGSARLLLILSVGGLAALYLAPSSHVVPLAYLGQMLRSGVVGQVVVGLFLGIPLVLGLLSLVGVLGRDLAAAATLLSVLVLLWPPAAVLLFGGDGTQLYVALALLWTAATAALCAAQLLALAAHPRA